jgi:hypothetical protein
MKYAKSWIFNNKKTPTFLGAGVLTLQTTPENYGFVPNARPRVKPVAVP